MRTTVTLDPDVEAGIKALMRDEQVGFKAALNHVARRGLGSPEPTPFHTRTFDMGVPTVSLDKALALADAISDEETIAKMARDA